MKFAIYQRGQDNYIIEIFKKDRTKIFYYDKTEKEMLTISDILENLGIEETSPDFQIL